RRTVPRLGRLEHGEYVAPCDRHRARRRESRPAPGEIHHRPEHGAPRQGALDLRSGRSLPQLDGARMKIPSARRILVIGAGVGGIAIARALLRDGHNVTVFEQRPDMRPGGGAVTIWPNGSTVLEQLGVDMNGAGQLLSTVRIATSTGRPLVTIDLNAIVDRLGAPVRQVPRRVLLGRLLEGFPADRIRCNFRAVGVLSSHDGVRVQFEDGSSADGDLLIGADGLHSMVRNVVGGQPAKPTGWCSWQGLITLPDVVDKDVALQIIGERGNVGLWPAGGSDLQWWFDLPWSTEFVRPDRPIDVIRSNFTGWS